MPVVWWDGALVETHEALVPAAVRGVQYGLGVFETLRMYRGVAFRAAAHIARFTTGAEVLGLAVPARTDLLLALRTTCDANHLAEAAVRLTLLASSPAGAPPRGTDAAPSDTQTARTEPAALHIAATPVPAWEGLRSTGTTAIISRVRRDPASPLAGLKLTSAAANVFARREAADARADEALLFTPDGHLSEASAANVFFVRDGVLCTPSLDCGCLPGVTRRAVLDLAPGLGLSVSEGRYDRFALADAEECFMTGSVREVVPVVAIDGADVGSGAPGAVTRDVQAAYAELVREEVSLAEMR